MSGPATIGQASDIAHMVKLQPQWQIDYQQLSAGPYLGRVAHVSLPGLHLTEEVANRASRQQGSLSPDDIGLALASSPIGPCRFHGHVAGGDSVMLGTAAELDLVTPDDCRLLATLMPRAPLFGLLWQTNPHAAERLSRAPTTLPLKPGEALRIRQLMESVLGAALHCAAPGLPLAVARQMQDALVLAWYDVLVARFGRHGPHESPTLAARRTLVERACEQVRDALPEPPTMVALCHALGVSPRTLEHCFRDVLGLPPARYLRLMRLNGAHRQLVGLGSGQAACVQDVAAQWGFWHMGAFARDHRELFGCLPSQLLRGGRLQGGLLKPPRLATGRASRG